MSLIALSCSLGSIRVCSQWVGGAKNLQVGECPSLPIIVSFKDEMKLGYMIEAMK